MMIRNDSRNSLGKKKTIHVKNNKKQARKKDRRKERNTEDIIRPMSHISAIQKKVRHMDGEIERQT